MTGKIPAEVKKNSKPGKQKEITDQGTQVDKNKVIVSSTGDQSVTQLFQSSSKCLTVVDNLQE